jgi:hypothetical protein
MKSTTLLVCPEANIPQPYNLTHNEQEHIDYLKKIKESLTRDFLHQVFS